MLLISVLYWVISEFSVIVLRCINNNININYYC